jgi:NAD(P)-dependent dehydrogenase (short-subunit alcohol dehydrogenase family)
MGVDALRDKVVVVTGASSGLGARFARVLAAAGARPVLAARRAERLAALREELGGAVETVACDVTEAADRERLIETAWERHGRLDGLVNNAGTAAMGPALKLDPEVFAGVVDTNLVAPFALSCLAARRMRESGGGAIVNVASTLGLRGSPNASPYSASKHGVIGLTRTAAIEYAPHGVRVNAVCPGAIDTPMMDETFARFPGFREVLVGFVPMGRMGTAAEVANAIAWLLSDAAAFVTGEALTVEGGLLSR